MKTRKTLLSRTAFILFVLVLFGVFLNAQTGGARYDNNSDDWAANIEADNDRELARKIIELDGQWQFLPDLDPAYHMKFSYKHPDWDRRHWDTVPVPGCWNKYGERYVLFEGVAWFAREFMVDDFDSCQIAVLRFGAVNYQAHVFLNGELVSTHEGGYTEFTLDVTGHLRSGRNVLVVRVDNRANIIKLPEVFGWFNYGGIHRSVQLEISNHIRIENVLVHAFPEENTAIGRIRLQIQGKGCSEIRMWITGPDGREVWSKVSSFREHPEADFVLPAPQLWSPENPYLYSCSISAVDSEGVELDYLEKTFGVRRLTAEGTQLHLNGAPIYLKGICTLFDFPKTGITYNSELFAHDLSDFADLGVNTIRSHFPLDEQILDACDRAGLMVWLEAPIYCVTVKPEQGYLPYTDPHVRSLAQTMVREMTLQAYNHPSVVFWSVGNECNTEHADAAAFFGPLVEIVRQTDPYRLIAFAAVYGISGCMTELVDVMGINEYWGWYDRCGDLPGTDQHPDLTQPLDMSALREGLTKFVAKNPNMPLLLTEFGADAVPGYRSIKHKLWSEDYQAELIKATLETVAEFPEIVGVFPFLYHDYPDPSKRVQRYWNGENLKGVVSYDRNRKLVFNVLKKKYAYISK